MCSSAGKTPAEGIDLEQRLALAEAINRISASMSSCLNLQRLLDEVVSNIKGLLSADGASVFLLDSDGSLRCDTVSGGASKRLLSGLRLAPGEGVAGWVAERRRSVLIPNIEADARFSRRVDETTGYRSRTMLAVPLVVAGELVGVLEAVNRTDGECFSMSDLEIMEALAPHVAVAVGNAKLTGDLKRHAEDLEHALEKRIGQVIFAKKEWEATVDAFLDPILLVGPDLRVRRANTATSRRGKVPISTVPGRTCHEVAFGSDIPCDGCPLPDALQGRPACAEIRIGSEVHHASHFPVQDEAQGVYAVACCYRDVTAAREMEGRLQEAERMASVGRLAAGIAHEINNPLAFMSSNLRVLKEYFEDLVTASGASRRGEGAREHLEMVSAGKDHRAGSGLDIAEIAEDGEEILVDLESGMKRIGDIVRQLGSFACEKKSTEGLVSLGHSVQRAVQRLAADFPSAKIEVRDLAEKKVRGCEASFDQTVFAVLLNALQASPELVRVTVHDEGGGVAVVVEDRGPGIAEQDRSRVCEPFFTTKEVGTGMGLGLSKVYATVTRHRGSLTIGDAETGGAKVVIRLPEAGVKSA